MADITAEISTSEIIAEVEGDSSIEVTVLAGQGPAGDAGTGGGGSSWLTNGQLDVDTTYRYITGFQPDGDWQVNRRHRTTKVLTIATAANNPGYTYTNQTALRAARATLTYA